MKSMKSEEGETLGTDGESIQALARPKIRFGIQQSAIALLQVLHDLQGKRV